MSTKPANAAGGPDRADDCLCAGDNGDAAAGGQSWVAAHLFVHYVFQSEGAGSAGG